ncbi:MAG: hypothetical protein Q9222_001968 [Ikaeria aurantiellina]
MYTLEFLFSSLLTIFLLLSSQSIAAVLPVDGAAAPIAQRANTNPPATDLTLPTTRPPFKEGFAYRLPGNWRQYIIFTHWSTELSKFDDVIDVLDKAEDELAREVKSQAGDRAIEKRRGWNFHSAHLVVTNDNGLDGMNHRDLLGFLNGLRLFGQQFGFWTCDMEFYDGTLTVSTRGKGRLEWAQPPREGVVADAGG